MSQHSQRGEDPEPASMAAGRAAAGPGASDLNGGRPLHMRSFKLRFASQREPGRSNVSLVKPLGLPATVAEGPQRAGRGAGAGAGAEEAAALRRVRDMFAQGPRDKYTHPVTASHVYGWWWDEAPRMAAAPFSDRRLNHHIQDSPWLKARLLVLADDKLKQLYKTFY